MGRTMKPAWRTAEFASSMPAALPDNARAMAWAEIAGLIDINEDGSWQPSAEAQTWLSRRRNKREGDCETTPVLAN